MTSGLPISNEMAQEMGSLLARGRTAFAAYLDALPDASKPIGGATMRIVRENDFIEHVELVMSFVHLSRATIYILNSENDLSALMAPFGWRR